MGTVDPALGTEISEDEGKKKGEGEKGERRERREDAKARLYTREKRYHPVQQIHQSGKPATNRDAPRAQKKLNWSNM